MATPVAFRFWARVWLDDEWIGSVDGMTRAEVEEKAAALAGEPVEVIWSDQKEPITTPSGEEGR